MSDANKGKYDIDELVNTLLLERRPEVPAVPEEPETEEVDGSEELYIVDPTEVTAAETEDEVDEEPAELLDLSAMEEAAVAVAEEQIQEEEETFVSRVIDSEEEETVKVAESRPMPVVVPPAAAAPEVTPPAPKKRRGLFRRKMEDTATIKQNWVDYGVQPIGHRRPDEPIATEEPPTVQAGEKEVRTDLPTKRGATVDEFPEVKAPAETITMQVVLPSGAAVPRGDEHTRVIPAQEEDVKPTVAKPIVPPAAEEQLPDQISLEEIVRVEDIESDTGAPTDADADVDPETRLQIAREEKVREFTFEGEEEETNEPEEEAVAEEANIEDFTGYQDTKTVADELNYRCRTALLSLIITAVATVVLLIFTLLSWALQGQLVSPMAYLISHLFGLVLMIGLNYSTITNGLSGLFNLRANNDTAPAIAAAICLIHVIVQFLQPEALNFLWTPLAGLLLVFSGAAHHSHEVCVRRNFSFVSYPTDKYAAAIIEDENALQEIGRRAVSDGDATVAYFRRTGFLTDYLANAYDEDCGDDWSRWMTPVALVLSFVLSLLTLMGDYVNDFRDWLFVFTGMVCLSMPVTRLAVQIPLSACCRRILARGGFINGWHAVRRYSQPDALAVDIADLYPDESMLLHGIKTFSDTHIDDAILTAASLAVRSGGPLAMIFRRIIENKEEILYDVDSLVYEQGMGLSGWVDGRRVFVGNGRLLQNHGVDVPSTDYEARYAKDGRRLVYLAIAGQLSAMFVVSYLPDPEIQSALQYLCRSRVTLLVRSCDPNITASDLCESFELDEYYVDVLPAAAGRMYVQLTEKTVDSLPAVMASNGHILGTARVLSACSGLQVKATIALVIQTVAALLGLVLCLMWAMSNMMSPILPLLLMLVTWLLTWLIPLFKRA